MPKTPPRKQPCKCHQCHLPSLRTKRTRSGLWVMGEEESGVVIEGPLELTLCDISSCQLSLIDGPPPWVHGTTQGSPWREILSSQTVTTPPKDRQVLETTLSWMHALLPCTTTMHHYHTPLPCTTTMHCYHALLPHRPQHVNGASARKAVEFTVKCDICEGNGVIRSHGWVY